MLTCDLGCSPKKRHTEVTLTFGFLGNFALPCPGRSEKNFSSQFFFLSCVALGLILLFILIGLTSISGHLLSDTVLDVRNSKMRNTVFGVKKPSLENSDNGNTVWYVLSARGMHEVPVPAQPTDFESRGDSVSSSE